MDHQDEQRPQFSGNIDWNDATISAMYKPLLKGLLYNGVAGLFVGRRRTDDPEIEQLVHHHYNAHNRSIWWNYIPILLPSTLLTGASIFYLNKFPFYSNNNSKKMHPYLATLGITIFGSITFITTLFGCAMNYICPTPHIPDIQITKEFVPYDKDTKIPIEYKSNKIWIFQYPFEFQGERFGVRTLFINIDSDIIDETTITTRKRIVVYSPSLLDDKIKSFIKEKNWEISFIIAPNCIHTMFTKEWEKEFVNAKIIGAPNCDIRNKKVKWDYILNGNTIGPDKKDNNNMNWNGLLGIDESVLKICVIKTGIFHEEIVLFDKRSKVLIVGDHIENMGYSPENDDSWSFCMSLGCAGMKGRAAAPSDMKLGLNKKLYLQSVQHVLKFDFESIVMSHGRIIEKNAKDVYKMANAFVL